MNKEIYEIEWQQINITITYISSYSKAVEEIQGYKLAHITVKADKPLPITETGYRSIFLYQDEVSEKTEIISFIWDALEESAKSPEWIKHAQERNQLSLF